MQSTAKGERMYKLFHDLFITLTEEDKLKLLTAIYLGGQANPLHFIL